MTTPPATKAGSRWGSFLSGAVAGIESRLDTILAEDSDASARSRAAEKAAAEKASAEKNTTAGDERSTINGIEVTSTLAVPQQNKARSTSRNRTNERLQERLAKVVNRDSDGIKSPRSSSDTPSTASPAGGTFPGTDLKTPDLLTDSTSSQTIETGITAVEDNSSISGNEVGAQDSRPGAQEEKPTLLTSRLPINPSRTSVDSASIRLSLDATARSSIEAITPDPDQESSSLTDQKPLGTLAVSPISSQINNDPLQERTLAEHEAELEKLRTEHRDELNAHLERIDALQAKLTLLARSTAATAQAASKAAAYDSPDQKIAERDERIAQLLEEGTKLSATEIKHLGIIKKLRSRVTEEEKAKEDLKKRLSRVESTVQDANERARRAETELKVTGEKIKRIGRLEGEVEALRAERDGYGTTILELQSQLEESRQKADEADKKVQSGALEAKKRAADDLAEQLENARIEKKLLEERLRTDIKQAEEDAQRKEEQAKVSEMELKAEIANLESKIELLRTRTEEASSNPAGDSQAKLLRQIETLQTQYAFASENWQGIESTLTARVAALEKERDETAKRESEVRRKARDVGIRSRALEEDLEAANQHRHILEQDLESVHPQLQKLQDRSKEVETAFANMKADFERERQVWESEQRRKLQEERAKWQLELHAVQQNALLEQHKTTRNHEGTSAFSSRKGSTPDLSNNLYSRRSQNQSRNHFSSELSIPGLTDRDRPSSTRRPQSARSPSFGTPISPGPGTPRRQDSSPSLHNQLTGTTTAATTSANNNATAAAHGLNITTANSLIPPTPPTAILSAMIPLSAMAQAGTPSIHTTDRDHDRDTDSLLPDPSGASSSSPTRRTVADVLSAASTVGTGGPSVQLVERMSGAVRRLESEKAALREELARLGAQRDEARGEVVALMGEVEEQRGVVERVEGLEREKAGVQERYGAALEMLGEKSEEVEELRADVQDLKKIYRELVESTMKG